MGVYRSRILPHLMNSVMNTDENRARVCGGLEGTVVEIGFGSGLNIPYYPTDVHTVMAVEPAARSSPSLPNASPTARCTSTMPG